MSSIMPLAKSQINRKQTICVPLPNKFMSKRFNYLCCTAYSVIETKNKPGRNVILHKTILKTDQTS